MRTLTRLLLILAAGVLLFAPSASAITYGFIDSSNTFSNTGAFIVQSPSGQNFIICSGTLITPDVFLTASHCTVFYEQVLAPLGYTAYVSFDKSIPEGSLTSSQTKLLAVKYVVTNPGYNQAQSDSGDIGALVLERAVKGIAPATLPTCGLLDELAVKGQFKDAVFTAVGYGVQERVHSSGPPFFISSNPVNRMFAFSTFNSLNGGYIRLSQNPSTGNGGTCFGDSGGPNFLTVNGQQILAAVTVTGDAVCRSTNVDYRTDTQSASNFLSFVNAVYGTSIPVPCP